jgi:hypothetical protein
MASAQSAAGCPLQQKQLDSVPSSQVREWMTRLQCACPAIRGGGDAAALATSAACCLYSASFLCFSPKSRKCMCQRQQQRQHQQLLLLQPGGC